MSMIDYDARPVTPQTVLVGHLAFAVGYSRRDVSRNGVRFEGLTSTMRNASEISDRRRPVHRPGARGTMGRRPWAYGLRTAGCAGVSLVLALVRQEVDRTMRPIGTTSVPCLDFPLIDTPPDWTG
jgi:hypothetical protein